MGDKGIKRASGVMWTSKPVPMKFFGAWEVDKTPPNCIPRLCTVTINKLVLLKPYGPDVTSLVVAVRMQSSKRTLRSSEINISNNTESSDGVIETEMDLTFALQYPHFIKKGGNQLQILLQRRKRYKNRAILGFKTLAVGVINMAEVLQRSNHMEKELELKDNSKDIRKSDVVARVYMSSLKSQPVDHDVNGRNHKLSLNQSADGDSEDDLDDFSGSEGSDSEPLNESGRKWRKSRGKQQLGRESLDNPNQRNLKQKFIALIRKFKIPDSEASDSEEQLKLALEKGLLHAAGSEPIDNDDDDIFDFEDEESESEPEIDGFSIQSTPRPVLKPYFSSKSTLVGHEQDEDGSFSKLRLNSDTNESEKDYVEHSSSPKPGLRPFFSTASGSHVAEFTGVESTRHDVDHQDSSGTEQTPDTSDTSIKYPYLEDPKPTKSEKEKRKEKEKDKSLQKSNSVIGGSKNVKDTFARLLRKTFPMLCVDGLNVPFFFNKEKVQEALSIEARDDDIFVVTYPKCGTTWMRYIVWSIQNLGSRPLPSMHELSYNIAPFLERAGSGVANGLPSPRTLNVHFPHRFVAQNSTAKYIYVARDPRDTCVSYYHFARECLGGSGYVDATFDEFFELFITGNIPYGDYFDHLLQWWQRRNDPNVLFLTYEDMLQLPVDAVLRVADFISGDQKPYLALLTADQFKIARQIVDNTRFDNMKKMPVVIKSVTTCGDPALDTGVKVNFFRKGEAGDWVNYFSDKQLSQLRDAMMAKVAGTGLEHLWTF
ncbi:Phosphofurin acidic cluster sorting protein 1 [Halotydeus destructor]|nr:Phosphofurin acidic cluster sorting protein 1 [Halotydeus destructor]